MYVSMYKCNSRVDTCGRVAPVALGPDAGTAEDCFIVPSGDESLQIAAASDVVIATTPSMWCMVVNDCVRWFMVVYGGVWWCMALHGDVSWCVVV
jgi:hypothetical protein